MMLSDHRLLLAEFISLASILMPEYFYSMKHADQD